MSIRELMVMLAMSAVWGFHFVVIKYAVGEIAPVFYAAIRMMLVALILAPFLRWRPGVMGRVLAAGVCLGCLNYALMFSGLRLASASASAMAMELYVPFATLLSVVFLGERVGWRRVLGMALAFAGVALIAVGRGGEAGSKELLGLALVASGGLAEAVGAVLIKTTRVFRPHELLAWFALIGAVGLSAGAAMTGDADWDGLSSTLSPLLIGAIVYSAIGSSIFGHTAYYWLIQRLPLSVVTSSTLLTAMFAVTFSVILLHEPLTMTFVTGAALTLVGVGVVIRRNAEKSPNAPLAPESGAPEPVIFEKPAPTQVEDVVR